MKTGKTKNEVKKFDLEKMKFAKLNNMHLIIGGEASPNTTTTAGSLRCRKKDDDQN